jgi:CRISPR-associated protein Cmr2
MSENANTFVSYLANLLAIDDNELVKQVIVDAKNDPSLDELNALDKNINHALPNGQDQIDLVYGGATKIKGYVFEAAKLPEIRGASALLDWINEVRLPQLWGVYTEDLATLTEKEQANYLAKHGIIYASGGNILGFAPHDQGQNLAQMIENLYTEHTLTANSAAVSATFSLLELRYGRLRLHRKPDGSNSYYWIDDFLRDWEDPEKRAILKQYYYVPQGYHEDDLKARFFNRKTFGEVVTLLATMFNRRRDERRDSASGQNGQDTRTRFLPLYPMIPEAEWCSSSATRPAVLKTTVEDEERMLSEPSARKRCMGQIVKNPQANTDWFTNNFQWAEGMDDLREFAKRSWESQWQAFLGRSIAEKQSSPYIQAWKEIWARVEPASDLHDIAASSKGYIGMIYADGNNIGRLIATLKTPQAYADTSHALSDVAKAAVFAALAQHLQPVKAPHRDKPGSERYVYPFEILAIGGDDLLIIVPGNKAFDIALSIGYAFEEGLTNAEALADLDKSKPYTLSRYRQSLYGHLVQECATLCPKIGLSAGVVIAQVNSPVFFLHTLVEQLLKNAKKLAKTNVKDHGYYGGAIDFMVMKSITMVSDNISSFRKEAYGIQDQNDKEPCDGEGKQQQPTTANQSNTHYHLTARPYTWHEFAGLLTTLRELKKAKVPRSQLYRLREVLHKTETDGVGHMGSVLEYLYTQVRMHNNEQRQALLEHIEHAWCRSSAAGVSVPLPPWMPKQPTSGKDKDNQQAVERETWETIWTDMVEMYDMLEEGGSREPTDNEG